MREDSGLRNQLKATRTRLGLSQQELATAAGVTRQTIGGMEAGLYAPSASVALRLAKTLGCRVEELFWLEEDSPVIEAASVETLPDGEQRVMLAQIGGRWVAHALAGESAFRTEMIPADGLAMHQAGQEAVAVRLLDEVETLKRTVLLAGCAPALSLWARSAERWYPGLRVHWRHANSTNALRQLARKEIHAAGVHLGEEGASAGNLEAAQRAAGDRSVALVHLGVWEEGLLVQPGNPKRLHKGSDLAQAGVRLINREEGAGSRLLLDALLKDDGIPAEAVAGYTQTVGDHLEVAREVQSGRADAGVSAASVAAAFGLGFVPLRRVSYDLALLRETLDFPPMQQLIGTLHHRWVRSQLNALGGYDTARTGEIIPASAPSRP